MRQNTAAAFIIFLSVIGLVVLNSAYIVDETEQVVITQFGEPVGEPVQMPGLHWKLPVVQVVHKFDDPILEWAGYPPELPPKDKKFIWVDVTGRWRIADPLLFLQTMHSERNAQTRLDDIMDGITRNFITRHDVPEIIRSSNKILDVAPDEVYGERDFEEISEGRDEITRQILETARGVVKEYGIELIDLRIKRINYIQSVLVKVFERMISERTRAAEELRSEGQGARAKIEGQKGKELKRIESEAYHEAQRLRGEADAAATKIYGDAYSKDPAFYAFMSTLEKYPDTLKDGRILLTTDSEFMRYLKK